jgi:hypothetical protein
MKNASVRRVLLTIVCFALASIGISNAQEPLPGIHVLSEPFGLLEGRLRVWSFDEQTDTVTPIVDIPQEGGLIDASFIVDTEQRGLYFVIIIDDNTYPPYLGESRVIRHDWETGIEEVVYERPNLVAISKHIQKNRLIISYYPEDTQYVRANTLIYSCLLDLDTQICYEFGEVSFLIPYDWIWLDTFRALRVKQWGTFPGEIELINIETGEIRPVVTIADEYFKFWQAVPNSTGIFLVGGIKETNANGEIEYHFYRLNPQTFETTFLTSASVSKPMRDTILSPDGKRLLFLQLESWDDRQASDSAQVVDVETGALVLNYPLIIPGPSGEQLVLDDFQWASDSAEVFAIASPENSHTSYIVRIDARTGNIDFLTKLEYRLAFRNPCGYCLWW